MTCRLRRRASGSAQEAQIEQLWFLQRSSLRDLDCRARRQVAWVVRPRPKGCPRIRVTSCSKEDAKWTDLRSSMRAALPQSCTTGPSTGCFRRVRHPKELQHEIGEEEAAIRRALTRVSIGRTLHQPQLQQRIRLWSTRSARDEHMIDLKGH